MSDFPTRPVAVRGTQISKTDGLQHYREKIARVALDSMVQFVSLLDANGTVVEVNRMALDAAGVASSDVEGKPFSTTFWWQVSPETNAELREMIRRAAAGEFVRWSAEIYGRTGTKETITVDASLAPVIGDDGRVVFMCAELRTPLATREGAAAANRTKDEFLAMLGHELRNPLSPIVTALQLMKLQGPEGAERARVIIERQVGHLTRLVDDLLDVSRIARGKVALKLETLELSDVVRQAIDVASPLLEQRAHMLQVQIPSTGLAVTGDAMRLSQVVSNLVTNAAKYTPSGGNITISAAPDNDNVVLKVQDTGIGIAPGTLPHIFDLFQQERQGSDRAQGGLGLGLTIVRNLVELHGGTVTAHSEGQGKGSEFVVCLPRASIKLRAATPFAPGDFTSGAGQVMQARRVLVVDDNEDAGEMLSLSLTVRGYSARVAHDGVSALRLAEDFRPHAAVLDIGLPVMDGYELAEHIRRIPGLEKILLVAVTGYGQESDRRKSEEAGIDHHFVKPVDIKTLASVLA